MRVVGSSANMSSLRRDKGEVIIEKKSIFFSVLQEVMNSSSMGISIEIKEIV